jgi:outer membrane protein
VAQLASNQSNVINADNNLQLSLLQLKQAMFLPDNYSIGIIIPKIKLEKGMLTSINSSIIYKKVETNMPEIRSADGQVVAAKIGVQVAKGNYYPSLRLNAGLSTNYSSIIADRGLSEGTGVFTDKPIGFVGSSNGGAQVVTSIEKRNFLAYPIGQQWNDNFGQFINLNLSIPIFNNYQVKANVQRAKIISERAVIKAQQVRHTLRQTIETSSNDALSAAKLYESFFKSVEAQEESFRATKQRYENGAANYTEYQIAENNLFQSKSNLLRAKYSFFFKLKVLDFYQGNIIEF